MKILVVYYSRDGHTKTVAQEIATSLSADIEEVRELTSRAGIKGWLLAGKDATLKKIVPIEESTIDPTIYDLIIIGTPIWAFTMSCGIRAWLDKHCKNLKQVIFFATMGSKGDKRAFADMEKLCGKSALLTASFIDKTIVKKEHKSQLDNFIKEIRNKAF